ncbi:MAG: polysaccharide deacetylase family protein [Candidatus Omnitrophota bacterium]
MSKFKKLTLAIIIILATIFLATGFIFYRAYTVPVLMYHFVKPGARPQDRLAVSVVSFERQMSFLRRFNYNIVPLEGLARMIKEKRKIPPRTVAITFDDGNKEDYLYAFPILRKYSIPATIFLIVNEVGRPRQDKLTWEQVRMMQDSGLITVGSHCLGPEPLINLGSVEELENEIFGSKRALEDLLGREVNLFSYPEGRFNSKIRQLVIDAGYDLAVATNPGKKIPNADLFALKRLRISASSDNLFVFWIETSGFYNFIREHRHK